MNKKKKSNELLEWAVVHNEFYATSKKELERLWNENKAIIKDIDVQGFHSVKKIHPHSVGIFIYPPSINELKRRILKRRNIPEEEIKIRLSAAAKEISQAHLYDFKIINDDFETAWKEFKGLIKQELTKFKL